MQNAIQAILASMENAGASRVTNVQLVLGTSGHFTEGAVRMYFQALAQDTPIEGTTLTLSWLPASYQCLSCQHRFEISYRWRHALNVAISHWRFLTTMRGGLKQLM